jgi:low affinity Fe/Cu permease
MMKWVSDWTERIFSHPITLAVILALAAYGWVSNHIDVANYLMSVLAITLLMLWLDQGRRDRKAAQAKLDELVAAIPQARTELTKLEEQEEEEIERTRL